MSLAAPRRRPGPLLPRRDGGGALMAGVIAVIAFVAGMAAIGGLAAGRAAEDWRVRLGGSATVAVRAFGLESPDAAAARAAEALLGVRGVGEARILDPAASDAMIARLIGGPPPAAGQPAARLVSVAFKQKAPATAGDLARALKASGLDAAVDDHDLGTSSLLRAAGLAALAIVGLVAVVGITIGAAAAAATRQGLARARALTQLLRIVGATDGFIAGLFQARSMRLAAWAGGAGAIAAALTAGAWRAFGSGQGAVAAPPLAWTDLAAAAPVPLVAALIGAAAARLTARSALKSGP